MRVCYNHDPQGRGQYSSLSNIMYVNAALLIDHDNIILATF